MGKKLSGFSLKIIALFFMVVDHVTTYLGPALGIPAWFSLLGRFVAPLFVFFMVEAYFYTRNKKKYFIRLFVAGILMHLINIIRNILIGTSFENPYTGDFDVFSLLQGQNIFMTLALLFAFIWALDRLLHSTGSKIGNILVLVVLFIPILISEGGAYEIVIGIIFYLFRGNFKRISIGIIAFSLLLFSSMVFTYLQDYPGTFYSLITFDNEFMIFSVLPFIYLYNGKKGGSGKKWEKNLFYYFYPAHLIVIYALQYFLK
ncbi:TraX family protein [Enterococcus sp. LJL120]